MKAAAAPTTDPVVEAQWRESREKLAQMDATLRQQELLAAALSEPEPRELLTPGQRAALEAAIVHGRTPEAVRERVRARAAWDAAGRLRDAAGQVAYFVGEPSGGLSYRVAEVDAEGRVQVTRP